MKHQHRLQFPELDREITAASGETIFHAARREGVRIVGACGGRGTCGACAVLVVEGQVSRAESETADVEENQQHVETGTPRRKWMRACQVIPRTDCVVKVAPRSLAPVARADREKDGAGKGEILPLDAMIVAREVTLAEATLADTTADFERVARALDVPVESLDWAAAREVSGLLRAHDWQLQARLRGTEMMGFAAPNAPLLGLAVDLGTTNAAAFLIDLATGARLASLGIENPQAAWGADLISRINHAITSKANADELQHAAIVALNALAHDLCFAIGAKTADIVDAAVCANTAMQHLLLGLPVRQLGRAPFVAVVRRGLDVAARDLGLGFAAGARVHFAPNIGGFVGGDHVTALLATRDSWAGATTSLVMDIGTNTEISLIHKGEIISASSPSGPALEGGHISCGMRAADGAIERVGINADGRIAIATIGNKPAIGLCGSGVLDTLATMLRAGILDKGGRLSGQHPDTADVGGKRAAVLAPGVTFTQHDVRAVQLAKAAIRTAVEMLLREMDLTQDAIEHFIIAGAFGAYIDVQSGIEIGLFPDLPLDRFTQVGNAAGLGIRRMLASKTARAEAAELAARCRYVELSTKSDFQKHFLHNIGFATVRYDLVGHHPARQ